MDIKGGLLLWLTNFLIKSQKLVVLIHRFRKRKRMVCSRFKGNVWGADLADMHLIRRINKGFRFLLWVIDIFSKYAWVAPLKDKKKCEYC